MPRPICALSWRECAAALAALSCLAGGATAAEGGLYIAGDGFAFQAAAQRALAQNPGGRRFFLLTLPPDTTALGSGATPTQRRLRERVIAANGVLLVCQRDLDSGRIGAGLIDNVVAVRGWPAGGSNSLPAGQRHFAGEDPAQLPQANEALRRLRSTCS
jgi:hypothetical protein